MIHDCLRVSGKYVIINYRHFSNEGKNKHNEPVCNIQTQMFDLRLLITHGACTQRYALFFRSSISRSRFLSDKRFRLPEVASPAVEKVRSTGVDDAGITKVSIATVDRSG